ncbi:GNAT family N-acetyltransferase [Faecalispora anaeroviscerum]|uniref:GNAT family N-acetyltransferase n=1 Tax=Faecalispora anaeroviscerum TaxID=2991836 RepID=UPI0024BB3421|nr:GNAT family N-acetyltransferase [Faecalispora anaeroviscerum]
MSLHQGPKGFTIRVLQEEDLPAVLEIWLSANLQAHDFIPEEYWRQNLPMVGLLLPQAQVLVCEAEGRILGFSGLDDGHIEGIFVDAPARSNGIGKALLDEWKQRFPTLTLCVYEKNKKALAFYLREGFSTVRRQKDAATGEAEYVMRWGAAE